MADSDFEAKAAAIQAEREKASRIGCAFNIVGLIVGVLGWIVWEWYALPLAFLASIVLGAVYSARKAGQVRRQTGLTIDEQMEIHRRSQSRRQ